MKNKNGFTLIELLAVIIILGILMIIAIPIKPVLYLKPSVNITGGTGTSTDPYILSL